jgi:lipopolysaccharide transport system ATP-binding protein
MSDVIIKVEGLGKKYTISHEKREGYTALRDVIGDKVKGLVKRKPSDFVSKEDFWALKDVNFEVKRGEAVGIIGRNGAGKSTLLKILSRITEPTHGRIELNGRIASLLEVGTGFHPELTGRENIFLNGAVLGMTRTEIKRKFDEIVDFSGVETFLDTPVKRYSSGMYVRLAFAVAAHLEPEILVIDEVLAVGDAEFQKKCLGKMDDISKKEGRTVIFVSHQLGTLAQLCSHSILLNAGKILTQGKTSDVIYSYLHGNNYGNSYTADTKKVKDKICYISQQCIIDKDGNPLNQFTNNDSIILEISIVVNKWDEGLELSMSLQHKAKGRIFTVNKLLRKFMKPHERSKIVHFIIPPNTITPNNYSWLNSLHIPGNTLIDVLWDECSFNVIDVGTEFARYDGSDYGAIFLNNYDFKTVD